jgi:hypothetical protein
VDEEAIARYRAAKYKPTIGFASGEKKNIHILYTGCAKI